MGGFHSPFSSEVRPRTEVSPSRSRLSFMTRSARTKKFLRSGLTISSLSTLCTSVYSGMSAAVWGRYSRLSKTLKAKMERILAS